jgi:hypothetical protein
MPKNRPQAIVMNSPKPRTVPSRRISSTRGTVQGISVRNACIERTATVSPQAPLTSASETLSVSSCRARRAGRAPSAARSASSLWRLVARGEHEIGDIRAGDQEDDAHRAKEDQERHAQTRIEHRIVQPLDPHAPVSIRGRELLPPYRQRRCASRPCSDRVRSRGAAWRRHGACGCRGSARYPSAGGRRSGLLRPSRSECVRAPGTQPARRRRCDGVSRSGQWNG